MGSPVSDHSISNPIPNQDTSKSGSSSSLADSKYQLLYTNSKSKLLLDDESSGSNNSDSKHSSVNPQSHVSEQSNRSPQAGNLNIQPCEIINVEEFVHQSSESEDDNDDESFDRLYLQGIHLEQQLKQNVSSNIATASIQDYIDYSFKLLSNDWIGKIIFPVYYGNNTIHRRNIVKYIGNPETWHNHPNFYFPIKTYDPKDKGFDSLGFLSLVKDLQRAAIRTGGFQLTKTGKTFSKGNLNGYYRLSCSRCQTYRGNSTVRQDLKYRNVSFRNDRKNNRLHHGRRLSRRTKTSLPLTASHRCPFFIKLCYDDKGFFLNNRMGNPTHKHHPKHSTGQVMIPPRLMEESERNLLKDLILGDSTLGIMRNVMHSKSEKYTLGPIYST